MDARHYQILYLGAFLLLGIKLLGWDAEIGAFLTLISTALITQLYFIRRYVPHQLQSPDGWINALKSPLITALGLCLLLKANDIWILAFAAALAIASKFLIRIKGKHVFNPANFGIMAAILLTGNAWVSPGQWGSSFILLFALGVLGCFILLKVGRIDTSITFLATFSGLEFIRSVLYLGWGVDFWLHQLSSGALLLFTFFMITDPVTTPNSQKGRIIWAALIGILSFFFTNWFYAHTAPIIALFISAPITAILDRIFIGQRFQWQATSLVKT